MGLREREAEGVSQSQTRNRGKSWANRESSSQNVGIDPRNYMVPKPKTPPTSYSQS
jgi:hypothetical protein